VWAAAVVTVPDEFATAVAELVGGVLIAEDLAAARRLIDAGHARVVTREGDVLGRGWLAGGSATGPSVIEIQAAVEEARQQADQAAVRHGELHAQLAAATAEAERRRAAVAAALTALNESDARLSAVAERLAQLGQAARSADAETARLDMARAKAEQARDRDLAGLSELEERLRRAQDEPAEPAEPDTAERDAVQRQLVAVRAAEMEARLAVRTGEERVSAVAGRAEQLLHAAGLERAARQRRREAREARARGARLAAAVREVAEDAVARIAASVAAAAAERDSAQRARGEREQELQELRGQTRTLAEELATLTDAVHRDEMVRAEQRLRIETLQARAADEYGVEPDALVAEYGPDQPCPPSSVELAEYEQARDRGEQVVAPQPGPYHRPTQEKRAARAERDLALLGKVNPLALEEFAALEERHQFLSTQLEDLKATRRDLLTVVKEVDERILEVFTSAFTDVAAEFETVFTALFPGGEGRLVLTDPDDMLLTGIDVEARPPGKKVKRLSLLSGGERALVAVALLVAIFRARPSPFYVMDEIEAALDDINLGRLLELVGELRASSQIIVITHQKRTMEIADALYGVTMRGDGVTQVISQRLRDTA
jgi:chromosome segregation protein